MPSTYKWAAGILVLVVYVLVVSNLSHVKPVAESPSEVFLAKKAPIETYKPIPQFTPIDVKPIEQIKTEPVNNEPKKEPQFKALENKPIESLSTNIPEPIKPKNSTRGDTEILDQESGSGKCSITIKNDASEDTIVKVVNMASDLKFATIYVRRHDSIKVSSIPDGDYQAYALFGSGFVRIGPTFDYKSSAMKLESICHLQTTTTEAIDGTETHWSTPILTLFESPGIQRNAMSISEFDRL